MRWLLLIACCQTLAAGPLQDRLSVTVEAGYAFQLDGYTRLRHFNNPGDRLSLPDELGVDNWLCMSLEAGWRFDGCNELSAAYTLSRFRGEKANDRSLTHEGATFAPGTQLRFDRTGWQRLEAWYRCTPWRSEHAAVTLLGGAMIELLDVYVVASPGPASGKRDDHENFGTLAIPLPALGLRFEWKPLPALTLALEGRGTYADNLPTWYGDDGRTRHSQTAFDGRFEVSYRAGACEFGAALHYRMLHLEQTNDEDGNEFNVRGTLTGLFVRVWL